MYNAKESIIVDLVYKNEVQPTVCDIRHHDKYNSLSTSLCQQQEVYKNNLEYYVKQITEHHEKTITEKENIILELLKQIEMKNKLIIKLTKPTIKNNLQDNNIIDYDIEKETFML